MAPALVEGLSSTCQAAMLANSAMVSSNAMHMCIAVSLRASLKILLCWLLEHDVI